MLRYLFRFSFAFAVVIALLTLIAFFLPRRRVVERSVTVEASPAAVFPLFGDLARWKDWGIWYERDDSFTAQFSRATTGVGAWTTWTSKRSGTGRLEFLSYAPGEAVTYRKGFENIPLGWDGSIKAVGTNHDAQTIVTWRDEVDLGWSPIKRWFGLFLPGALEKETDASLAKLKAVAEKTK